MNVVDKTKEWFMNTLKPCASMNMVNLSFGIDVKKMTTDELTHYPIKMMQCNGLEDDVLGAVLPDSSRDGIFVVKKTNTPTVPTVEVTDVKIYSEKVFAHEPMTCKVGTLTLLSWNLDGRCFSNYSKSQQTYRKNKMIALFKKVNPDILCLQNFFVRKQTREMYSNAIYNELRQYLGEEQYRMDRYYREPPNHKIFHDGYTDAIIVKQELVSAKSIPITLPRYNDYKKQTMMLYIQHAVPFYIVNVHLSTPKTAVSTHQLELNSILSRLKEEESFEEGVPAVCMGCFNQGTAEELFLQAKRRKYTRGGAIRSKSARKGPTRKRSW